MAPALIYVIIFGIGMKLYDGNANTFLCFTVYPFVLPLFWPFYLYGFLMDHKAKAR